MKVGTITKIIFASFVIIAITFSILTVSNANEREAVTTQAVFKQLGLNLSGASDFLTEQARVYVQYGEKKYYDAYMEEVEVTKTRERVVAELKAHGVPSNELALVEKAAQLSNTLAELETKAFAAVAQGDLETARELMFGSEYEAGKMPIIETMNSFQLAMETRTAKMADSAKSQAGIMLVVFSGLFLSVAVIIIISLISIGKKMNLVAKLSESATQIASGNIDVIIDNNSRDEIGVLAESFNEMLNAIRKQVEVAERLANGDLTVDVQPRSSKDSMGISLKKMVENLNHMFGQINLSAGHVTDNSKRVAERNQDFAHGTAEAANLSGSIKTGAEKGSEQMNQMMQAVKEITNASSSISKVIKLLDDIASQTKILALNASVEAMRVGDAGKGFVVVAEEVRNLAAKSADAAKDIGDLITNSIDKANLGMKIATETSSSLRVIVDGIKRNSEIVSQIAQLSAESATMSEQMSKQSSVMQNLMSKFKTKDAESALYRI